MDYKVMEAFKVVEIMKKYAVCPQCGSSKIKQGKGGLIIEEETFTRACHCGFKITVDEDGKKICK